MNPTPSISRTRTVWSAPGRRRLGSLAALLVALLLALTGCGGTSLAENRGDPKTLTIAAVQDNNSFDTAQLQLGNNMQYWWPVYDTLIIVNAQAELEPGLATDWTYNDDETILTLNLRDDVVFTDGTAFTSAAVKANLEHLANGGGQFSYMAQGITEVVPVSDTIVELHLDRPDPGLLDALALIAGAMASPAALEDPSLATNPVGSGPYVYDAGASTVGSEYIYTRNPDYWNPQAYEFNTIVIRPMPEATAMLNALKTGQVDTGSIPISNVSEAENSGLRIDTTPVNWRGLIIADRAGAVVPALGDVRVRRAINMAFNKPVMVENVLYGQGEVTAQPFGVESQAYVPELDDAYPYDLDQARALMAEAGYADGFDVTMPNTSGFNYINPFVAQQLGDIGIRVHFEQVPANSLIPELLSGRFPMYFFSLGSQDAWGDFRKTLLPNSPWNTSKTDSPELAALIEKVRYTEPGEERTAAMQDVNRWVVDQAWFAPFFRENTVLASNPRIELTPHAWLVATRIDDYHLAATN